MFWLDIDSMQYIFAFVQEEALEGCVTMYYCETLLEMGNVSPLNMYSEVSLMSVDRVYRAGEKHRIVKKWFAF